MVTAQAPAPKRLIAQAYVRLNGVDLTGEISDDLLRLRIDGSVHLPDMAVLELNNPEFKWSNENSFRIGDELQISFGDAEEKSPSPVFVGEITACEVEIAESGLMHLRIRAYDRAHRLHRGRMTRAFLQMTDSDIANKIAADLGFQCEAEATREVHEYMLQDTETNWEFLRRRAAVNGFELQMRESTLIFKPAPSTPREPVELALREELLSFRARMTSGEQVDEVQVRGWDPVNKSVVIGEAFTPTGLPKIGENRTGAEVALGAFHKKAKMLVAREPIYSQDQAERLAQTVLDELAGNFVTAEGVAMGDPKLQLGSEVKLRSVGQQFTGSYVVTQITHNFEPESYLIHFEVTGRRSTDLVSLIEPASRPQMHILQGIVSSNRDPLNIGRVKVDIPVLGKDVESNWCRVVAPGAGSERGMQYLPEVEDEVLLIGSDVNNLYVVGGLWNAKDLPPLKNNEAAPSGEVEKRIIRSRTGHVILLDDSGGSPGITIVDSSGGNRIHIDTLQNNLEAEVTGDIRIKASRAIELKAGTELKLSAGTNFSAESMASASVQAMAQLTLEGAASASLRSGGQAGIAAPMVSLG